jgi:hypothetical protein
MHRAAKLGDDVVAKLKGTTLDNAREMDALVMLNRGAPEGEHTETVKRSSPPPPPAKLPAPSRSLTGCRRRAPTSAPSPARP